MRDPNLSGAYGRAWTSPDTRDVRQEWPAGIGLWLLHCPGAHPLWSWYGVSACSLADYPGMSPALKRSPDMTHELQVFALHPDWKPDDDWFQAIGRHWLQPINLAEQVVLPSDDHARELLTLLVRSFCDGLLSPDTDFRSHTERAIQATADHMRRGAPCQGKSQ